MTLINALGYPVTFTLRDQSKKTLPSDNMVARLQIEKNTFIRKLNGKPVCHIKFGASNLPPEKEGSIYIVATPVLQALKDRKDLVGLQYNGATRNQEQPNKFDSFLGLICLIKDESPDS
jgi:hypothetical protein